jgi:hypothetical protein
VRVADRVSFVGPQHVGEMSQIWRQVNLLLSAVIGHLRLKTCSNQMIDGPSVDHFDSGSLN